MLLRILGLMLILSAVVSILVLAVPELVGLSYTLERFSKPDLSVGYDDNYIYLVYNMGSFSMAGRGTIYRYVAEATLHRNPYTAKPRLELPSDPEIYIYLVPPNKLSVPVPGGGILSKTQTRLLLSELSQKSTAMGRGAIILPPTITYTDIILVVVRVPQDSLKVEIGPVGASNIVSGRIYADYLDAYLSGSAITPSGYRLTFRDLLYPFQVNLYMEVKVTTSISAGPFVYLRAVSLSLLGILVITVDAGRHPEWYEGRWSIFRRLAEKLGIARSWR